MSVSLKARDRQGIQGLVDLPLVLGEVGQDLGLKVISHHRDVVVRLQLLREGIGGIPHVVHEPIVGGGELAQQHRRDGRLGALKADHLLRHAIFVDAEIGRLQIRHELVRFLQDDAYIQSHFGNIDAQRKVVSGREDSSLSAQAAAGDIRFLCLFGNGDRAIVTTRPPGIGCRLVRLLLLLLRGVLRSGRARRSLAPGRMDPGCSSQQRSQGCNG